MRTPIHNHQCKCFVITVVVLLCCLSDVSGERATTSVPHRIPDITPEMFFQPLPYRADVVLDVGDLGRYRFSEDRSTHSVPEDVTIRRELVELLNKLQGEFTRPMLLISGYRSQRHQIYLWAKWFEDNPSRRKALNSRDYDSWTKWVAQSQSMNGWHPLTSKHQTGDAVRFYWKGLTLDTERRQRRLTERIQELGGSLRYTAAERERFNIPAGDNARFKVTAYPEGEDVSIDNPSGRAYFHVEYRLSSVPEKPEANLIGRRIDRPHTGHQHLYEQDDIVLITVEDHYYLAKVMMDVHETDTELEVWFYVDDIREELGTEVPIKRILRKREKPKKGWGTKVALEYFNGKDWEFSWDAEMFANHYQFPITGDRKRRVEFDEVRYIVPQRKQPREPR